MPIPPPPIRVLISVLLWAFLATLPLHAGAARAACTPDRAIVASAAVAEATLDGGTLLLNDPARSLDLAAVLALPASRWRADASGHLRLGYEGGAVWARLCLRNPGTEQRDLVLSLDAPQLDSVDVYLLDDDRVLAAWHTGDQRPYSTRPIDYRAFAFPVRIPADATREAVLRLDMRDGVFPSMRMRLSDPPQFDDTRQQSLLTWGAYYGAILALLAYNLLLYVSTRDRSFLLYVVYLGSFAFWNFGFFGGFGFQWLWPQHPEWNVLFDVAFPALILVAGTAFAVDFLSTRERAPRMHRLLLVFTALLLPCPVAELAFIAVPGLASGSAISLITGYFMALSSVLTVLYLVAGMVVLRGGYAPARFFVLAWTFPFLGIVVHRLVRIPGLLPANAVTEHAIVIGSTLEFLLFALALGDRFKRIRDEALAAERRLHEAEAANAAALEGKVRERTQELDQAMAQVRQSLQLERRAREEQREFLTTVSHDLRTPLTLINTIAESLALDAEPGAEDNRRRYERILRAGERMSALLNDYLDEERFELLRKPMQQVPTDPRAMLEKVASAARVLADGQTVRVESFDLPPAFVCDPELTELALRNLADNAITHTLPGTTVLLRGRTGGMRIGDGIRLDVVDDGPGLVDDELGQIFKPGFRGRDSQGRPGKGLGLTLARRNIERQGGTLTATSEPGAGCCFSIWLPGPRGAEPRELDQSRSTTDPKL